MYTDDYYNKWFNPHNNNAQSTVPYSEEIITFETTEPYEYEYYETTTESNLYMTSSSTSSKSIIVTTIFTTPKNNPNTAAIIIPVCVVVLLIIAAVVVAGILLLRKRRAEKCKNQPGIVLPTAPPAEESEYHYIETFPNLPPPNPPTSIKDNEINNVYLEPIPFAPKQPEYNYIIPPSVDSGKEYMSLKPNNKQDQDISINTTGDAKLPKDSQGYTILDRDTHAPVGPQKSAPFPSDNHYEDV